MGTDRDTFLTELRVPGGSEQWCWVRWELFIFLDVRDVLATRQRDRVLIVHRGRALRERWLQALRDTGLDAQDVRAP